MRDRSCGYVYFRTRGRTFPGRGEVTCDGGQQMRERQIARDASGEGKGCDVDLAETRPCRTDCCDGKQGQDCESAAPADCTQKSSVL